MPDHPDHEDRCDIAAAGLLITDSLTGQDFSVRDLAEEHARVIQVTDARAAFCQLILTATGRLTWEYYPFTGRAADPAALTAITTTVLGCEPGPLPVPAWPGPTLLGTAGRMLRGLGLHTALRNLGPDQDFCEIHAHLTITRPAAPQHGHVILSDDGMITWECTLTQPGGLPPAAIASAIGRALSRLQYPGYPATAASPQLATA